MKEEYKVICEKGDDKVIKIFPNEDLAEDFREKYESEHGYVCRVKPIQTAVDYRKKYPSVMSFYRELDSSIELQKAIKKDPKKAFTEITIKDPMKNIQVFKYVISVVGIALFLTISFIGISTVMNYEVPEVLGIIASSLIAAIAGLLAPSPLVD